jgi:hypothetical protein
MQFGTVEYEVGGPYITRPIKGASGAQGGGGGGGGGRSSSSNASLYGTGMNSPMVHLYALDGSNSGKLQIYIEALKHVVQRLQFQQQRTPRATTNTDADTVRQSLRLSAAQRIGFLVYCQNCILIPHWNCKVVTGVTRTSTMVEEECPTERNHKDEDKDATNRTSTSTNTNTNTNTRLEWNMTVSFMTDVTKEPFCPLPLDSWTYSVSNKNQSSSIEANVPPLDYLFTALDSIPSLLKTMIPNYTGMTPQGGGISTATPSRGAPPPPPPPPPPSMKQQPLDPNQYNCGGAALTVMMHAIESNPLYSGGRGTLLTDSRLTHGLGMILDRQGNNMSEYTNANPQREQTLLTPLQDVKGMTNNTSDHASTNKKAHGRFKSCGKFYKDLETNCLKENVSLSIIYTSPLGHEVGSGITGKHYVDVATLGRLCHKTCGKFKWLKVEDGDVLVEGGAEKDGTYAHQLKEELV